MPASSPGRSGSGTRSRSTPTLEDGLLFEIAQAQAAREIFPDVAPEVHAADQAHDRERLPRLPAERPLRADLGRDRPVDPPARDADRSPPHARSSTTGGSRSTRRRRSGRTRGTSPRRSPSDPAGRIVRRAHEVLCRRARRSSSASPRTGLFEALAAGVVRRHAAAPGRRTRIRRSRSARDPDYANPFLEAWARAPSGGRGTHERPAPRTGPVRAYGDKMERRRRAALLHASDRPVAPSPPRRPSATPPEWGFASRTSTLARGRSRRSSLTSSSMARPTHEVDVSPISPRRKPPRRSLPARRSTREIARRFGRRLVVLGCALESDAHTVGHRRDLQPEGVRRRLRARALSRLRRAQPRERRFRSSRGSPAWSGSRTPTRFSCRRR